MRESQDESGAQSIATYHCLDLFSGLGGFSAAFEDAENWSVTTVDLNPEFGTDITADVLDLRPADLPEADVVLASPPCTTFSIANQPSPHWDGDTPTSDDVREHIALAHHTVGLIQALDPDYWFLENPQGGKMDIVLGRPTGVVTYCQYGLEWQKPTGLWGEHPPMTYRRCPPGADCHQASGHGFESGDDRNHIRDPAERSKVPYGLSEAILNAVEGRSEQTTLTGAPA